jgi:hypothetical protein
MPALFQYIGDVQRQPVLPATTLFRQQIFPPTLSIPNYKAFQESWSQNILSLIKIIEKITKNYNIK